MAQVTVYLPDDLHQAVKASGFNFSAVCQQAARDHLRMETTMNTLTHEMTPIDVEVEGARKRFTGRLVGHEDFGMDGSVSVYFTKRKQFAVMNEVGETRFEVFESFEELSDA